MRKSWDVRKECPSDLAAVLAGRLRSGEVGLLPTETVYGLMASSERPDACRRIYEIKGRASSKLLPFMTASRQRALQEVPRSRVAGKLARLLWPGPLTLVLGEGQGKAWRIPDHALMHDVLRRLEEPLVATSANTSGMPAPAAAEDIEPCILDAVDFSVLDEPSRGAASTIVRVDTHDAVEVLRQGAIPEVRIRELAAFRVEIVCTGNTCRSPLAAAILARELAGIEGISIQSCGTATESGRPASSGAIKAAAALGLDLSGHRSRPLPADMGESDLILCMTPQHCDQVLSRALATGGPPVELVSTRGAPVPDPWGGSTAEYESVASTLLSMLGPWAESIQRKLAHG